VKLPRDLSGLELARALGKLGYRVTRQTGSHLRLTIEAPAQHHVTIPAHDPLKQTRQPERSSRRDGAGRLGSLGVR
jgi:predicted RNA binding protein YcfA (HicA-like mRNA interferase family)